MGLNTVFMGVRFGQAACCMDISYGKLFMNLFNVVTWTTSCAFQLNTHLHREDVLEFFNQLMKSSSKYFEGKPRTWKEYLNREIHATKDLCHYN
jgi:hypothetical protein